MVSCDLVRVIAVIEAIVVDRRVFAPDGISIGMLSFMRCGPSLVVVGQDVAAVVLNVSRALPHVEEVDAADDGDDTSDECGKKLAHLDAP